MTQVSAAHGGVKPTSLAELGGSRGSISASIHNLPLQIGFVPCLPRAGPWARSVLTSDLLCKSPEAVLERAAQPELPDGFEEADLSLSRQEPYSGMRATLPLFPSFITAN